MVVALVGRDGWTDFFFCKSILFLYLFFVENVIFPQKMIFRKISQMDKNSRFRPLCVVASFYVSRLFGHSLWHLRLVIMMH
jgi:hypothetical protein